MKSWYPPVLIGPKVRGNFNDRRLLAHVQNESSPNVESGRLGGGGVCRVSKLFPLWVTVALLRQGTRGKIESNQNARSTSVFREVYRILQQEIFTVLKRINFFSLTTYCARPNENTLAYRCF